MALSIAFYKKIHEALKAGVTDAELCVLFSKPMQTIGEYKFKADRLLRNGSFDVPEFLGLSVRVERILRDAGIKSIDALAEAVATRSIYEVPGIGVGILTDLKELVKQYRPVVYASLHSMDSDVQAAIALLTEKGFTVKKET